MARSTANQPMTNNTHDLVIGLMKVEIGDAYDGDTPPATGSGSLSDLGAIQGASLVLEKNTKEHVSGYPEEEDFKILESKNIAFKISPEEIGSTEVRGIISNIFNSINTGNLTSYGVRGTLQKSTGDLIRLYSNHCTLKPEFNMSVDNDWGALEFNYEWEYDSTYTNNKPLYKSTASASERSRIEMPITNDATNLIIGRPQIRISNIGVSATGIVASAASASTLPASASIGAIQGATLAAAPTFKEHVAGYPEVKDFSMIERTEVTLEFQPEEFATDDGDIITETATTLFDIMLDSTINNVNYYCSAHVIYELADGGIIEFFLPNNLIESSAEITTQQDWSAFSIKLSATKQTALGSDAPDLIYLLPES